MWDNIDWETMNITGVGRHRVSLIDIVFWPQATTALPAVLAWSAMVFQTDATGVVPTSMLFDPLSISLDALQKRQLGHGLVGSSNYAAATSTVNPGHLQIRLEARHRVTSEDVIVLLMRPSQTCVAYVHTRTNVAG